ncbi:probable prolyl 4-hydroxylase 9 isoform X3 [Beta vulgaris subsp. vulgaris]|uniref:probable prolyl 4-hydroxylase 9 isoform X3 n=1 Tax=Beta vulgaris subsp. vulgaris TaxID=3555 RepID=UPI0020367153|nr:probable prolyl 4-hydroxylase 9 isoform X3 [Beta vulgaris subsp. vulgaris]
MKVKGRGNWSAGRNLGLPAVFFLCFFFFIVGFFSCTLIFQVSSSAGLRQRMLESTDVEDVAALDLVPSGESGDDSITSIPFQVLSWRPRALYFSNFATAEQCESIINIAKAQLRPSRLALRKGETMESTQGVRTRHTMSYITRLDKSIILIMMHSILLNMVHREVKGYGKDNRVASFLLYLSDVEEGGETMFPYENDDLDFNYDFKECIGLKVKPRRGDGLLFYSLFVNGSIDPTSLHGSCPVIKGEKWVATKWIRDQEQQE